MKIVFFCNQDSAGLVRHARAVEAIVGVLIFHVHVRVIILLLLFLCMYVGWWGW